MNFTLFSHKSGESKERLSVISMQRFLSRITKDTYDGYVIMLRERYYQLQGKASRFRYYDKIIEVCPVCEYSRKKDGTVGVLKCNGVVMIEVDGLNNAVEIERVKHEASLLPQTLVACEGCDGHSVVILALAALPGLCQPQKRESMELFLAQAYRTAVLCYTPALSFPITIRRPCLDMRVKMPFDTNPMVNLNAVPFIIEQSTKWDAGYDMIQTGTTENCPISRMAADAENVISMHQMFQACHANAMIEIKAREWKGEAMAEVSVIAQKCREAGLPEEEAVRHLLWHYYNQPETDVRCMVRTAYEKFDKVKIQPCMPKKQVAALRLRDFLTRRYEIRYNVVKGVTEYRRRQSLDFMFRDLTARDRNTIRHEAALEGIEAFDSEVNGLIESNYTKAFNPIDEYFSSLGRWDGKDHIAELASMVPNDNPNWTQLFSRWFLSMVAHWINNDTEHANSTSPLLIGAQGYRKSTFCRIILPPELRGYFTDSIDMRDKHEAERYLCRFLLVNIDEFDQLNDTQFAQVKHLFQKPEVSMRRSYSSVISSCRRYASFIATTNQAEVLRDPTGNRRYLCVEVTAPIKTDKPIDYGQLYAQAVALIRSGYRYWIDSDDEALICASNRQFERQTPLEHIVRELFTVPSSTDVPELMKLTDIMMAVKAHPLYQRDMNNLMGLGRVLTKLAFRKQRKREGYYYSVVRN